MQFGGQNLPKFSIFQSNFNRSTRGWDSDGKTGTEKLWLFDEI